MLHAIRQFPRTHRLLLGLFAIVFVAAGTPPCAGLMGDAGALPATAVHDAHHAPEPATHHGHTTTAQADTGCHGDDCRYMQAVEPTETDSGTTPQSLPDFAPVATARAELVLPEPPHPALFLPAAERLPASPVMEHRVLRI